MPSDRIPISKLAMTRLVNLGLNANQLVRHAGISPSLLHQPKLILSTSQYFALFSALEVLSDDPLIGLHLGSEARADQFDPASFAALHSSNFGEALQRLARYKRLSCPEEIRIEEHGAETRISFHWLLAQGDSPKVLTDAAFASIDLLLRCGSGKTIPPLRIELNRKDGDMKSYVRHFGCDVRMSATQDKLIYHTATLQQNFITSNPDLIAALLPGLELQLDTDTQHSLDRQVKVALTKMMQGERPNIEVVARYLCLSPRTLQRRLTEIGTSYQEILDDVRADIAQKLLINTDMELGEIAFYLGFEELNSFQRAFHKWHGLTPTQWQTIQLSKRKTPRSKS